MVELALCKRRLPGRSAAMQRLHAIVSGKVQAVGFREFARHEAATRGLCGYVRNTDDGRSVEVVAEGETAKLEELLGKLHEGPRFARVDSVDFNYSEPGGGFSKFSVEM